LIGFSNKRKKDCQQRILLFLGGFIICVGVILFLGKSIHHRVSVSIAGPIILLSYFLFSMRWMVVREIRVPIFVFHSVSQNPKWLVDTHISISIKTFEQYMKYLSKNGYQTVFLDDVYLHIKGKKTLNYKAVALTFDDGYLDNWVAAYPILKKYNLKGTIFIPTDFVDPRPVVRKNLKDVWDMRIDERALEWRGYLSWEELKIMEKEGIFSVESHTKSHTWLFFENKIIDFYRPGDSRVWILWNKYPELKPWWYQHKSEKDIQLMGYPIYPAKRSLLIKRAYKGNPSLEKYLNNFVRENGGSTFFQRYDWNDLLKNEIENISKNGGEWETEEEGQHRIYRELKESRDIIEAKLNKKVNFLCWPGDETDEMLEKIALQIGYKATTSMDGYNRKEENPRRLKRIYIPHFCSFPGKECLNYISFVFNLKLFKGNYFYYIPVFF